MECQTVHEHLSAYLDRDLPLSMRESFDRHLAHCPQCRLTLAQLQTMTAWVRDFPPLEPSPLFLQQVTARADHLAKRSVPLLFRRFMGAFPAQMAAALVLVVSAALLWQIAPDVWQERQDHPPVQSEPWLSGESTMAPAVEVPAAEPLFEEAPPTPAPLVQVPLQRPVFTAREEPLRMVRDVSARPMLAGLPSEGGAGEFAFLPSIMLRAVDPVQTTQQVWEIVPRLGGALLQAQGMATPVGRTARGPVNVTFSLPATRYQALLDAIRQLPNTSVVEERLAFIGREWSPGSAGALRRLDYSQAATTPQMTLVITILPR
jgi:hypothetical protein